MEFLLKKNTALSNVPTSQGLPKMWGPFFAAKCNVLVEDLMPRDIVSSEPRHWMVFGQLVMAVQCCAEAPPPPCLKGKHLTQVGR